MFIFLYKLDLDISSLTKELLEVFEDDFLFFKIKSTKIKELKEVKGIV